MSVGYSGTPLAKKLGIKAGMKLYAHQAPPHYQELLATLPEGCEWLKQGKEAQTNFVHAFFKEEADLIERLPTLKAMLPSNGSLWLSWPKKAAKIKTDLNRELIREHGLDAGLVDVKVCAVDENWSGLKFVYRLQDR
ncbi:MAG: DUF3052 family protein [Bacteroidota bacterium]